jgi:hypothetical protein
MNSDEKASTPYASRSYAADPLLHHAVNVCCLYEPRFLAGVSAASTNDELKGDQEGRLRGEDGNAGDDGVPRRISDFSPALTVALSAAMWMSGNR